MGCYDRRRALASIQARGIGLRTTLLGEGAYKIGLKHGHKKTKRRKRVRIFPDIPPAPPPKQDKHFMF